MAKLSKIALLEDAPAVQAPTLDVALCAVANDPAAGAKAAAAGANLAGLVVHTRQTLGELRILIAEVSKFSGDNALLELAESLRA